MRVLVACELSGRVRDAFIDAGHDAVSNDILPSLAPGPHIQGDALTALAARSWDMLIAFPPCTALAVSGARWFPGKRADGSQQAAIAFFLALANADVERVAVENPIGIMSTHYRKPDQIRSSSRGSTGTVRLKRRVYGCAGCRYSFQAT